MATKGLILVGLVLVISLWTTWTGLRLLRMAREGGRLCAMSPVAARVVAGCHLAVALGAPLCVAVVVRRSSVSAERPRPSS